MNASITNACSSSIMNTNIIIAKKNLTKKNLLVHFLTVAVNDMFNMVY